MATNSPVAPAAKEEGGCLRAAPHSVSACPACVKSTADAMRHAASIARGKAASYTRQGETAKASAAHAIAQRIRADFEKGARHE